MSALKSFQSEIQEIHARELARQRGQASAGTPTSRNVHPTKRQALEETNISSEQTSSKGTGAEDEVEGVLVLIPSIIISCIRSFIFRHYYLAVTVTEHAPL